MLEIVILLILFVLLACAICYFLDIEIIDGDDGDLKVRVTKHVDGRDDNEESTKEQFIDEELELDSDCCNTLFQAKPPKGIYNPFFEIDTYEDPDRRGFMMNSPDHVPLES